MKTILCAAELDVESLVIIGQSAEVPETWVPEIRGDGIPSRAATARTRRYCDRLIWTILDQDRRHAKAVWGPKYQ